VRHDAPYEGLCDLASDSIKPLQTALEAWQKSVVESLNGKDYAGK
jgi:hypothetical protein